MLIMQENDSRLIKAARRTIRAEFTLVVVVIIIASWSVYALYKLSTSNGSEQTILGFTLSKQVNKPQEKSGLTASLTNDLKSSSPEQSVQVKRDLLTEEQITYLRKQNEERLREKLVKEILDGQKELNISMWPINHYNRSTTVEKVNSAPSLMQLNPVKPILANLDGGASNYGGYGSASSNTAAAADPAAALAPLDPEQQDSGGSDESNYKQVAETNRDPIESSTESPDSDNDYTQSSSNAGDEGPNDAAETTESPPRDDQAAKSSDSDDYPAQSGSAEASNSSDENSNADDQLTTTTEEPLPDDETMREAGLAIDEEVDRMTQPSLGVVSQHDIPINYNNTVQFDDTPASSAGVSSSSSSAIKPPIQGDLVARFISPREAGPSNRERTSRGRDHDLQVDHNSPITLSGVKGESARGPRRSRSKSRSGLVENKASALQSNRTKLNSGDPRHKVAKLDGLGRHKRSPVHSKTNRTIRGPNELDAFINSVDFDKLIGESSSNEIEFSPQTRDDHDSKSKRREGRSLIVENGTIIANQQEDRNAIEEGVQVNSANQPSLDQIPDSGPTRRFDLETPEYNLLATNDTGLQELLAQKQLLDALRQSKLPSPTLRGDSNTPGSPETVDKDHQTAGSLYSVDHGLLLYPSANEEHNHGHKSEGKKKKKHEMEKHKKKMTVAMKKGGHKKKKHKKEEKKFLKEKKFKGAKKGKKVHKGKGGKGGKKGKKLYKDKGFKKKGFKNVYHKEEFGQKKSYFDEFRDKDFKKKWKKFDDKYNYAQMKKWQAKNIKGAKKMKDQGEKFKKYDKSKWRKKYHKDAKEHSASMMKKKKDSFGFA